MTKYHVYKKWKPSEGRIFDNEQAADWYIARVKKAGGAKMIKRKYVPTRRKAKKGTRKPARRRSRSMFDLGLNF